MKKEAAVFDEYHSFGGKKGCVRIVPFEENIAYQVVAGENAIIEFVDDDESMRYDLEGLVTLKVVYNGETVFEYRAE